MDQEFNSAPFYPMFIARSSFIKGILALLCVSPFLTSPAHAEWQVTGYDASGDTKEGPNIVHLPFTNECAVGQWPTCMADGGLSIQSTGAVLSASHTVTAAAGYNDSQELYTRAQCTVTAAHLSWVGGGTPPSTLLYKEFSEAKKLIGEGYLVDTDGASNGLGSGTSSRVGDTSAQVRSSNVPEGQVNSFPVPNGATQVTIPLNRTLTASYDYVLDGGSNPAVELRFRYAVVPTTTPLSLKRKEPCDCGPADAPGADASGCGPSSGDPVELASGNETTQLDPDLQVFNPRGPSVSWGRVYSSYRSQQGSWSPGMSAGWTHSYDWRVVPSKSDWTLQLRHPDSSVEPLSPALGTDGTPQGTVVSTQGNAYYTQTLKACPLQVRAGALYSAVAYLKKLTIDFGNGPTTTYSWEGVEITDEDGSQRAWGASDNFGLYLTKATSPTGQSLDFYYDYNNGQRLIQIADSDTSTALLFIDYDTAGMLSRVTDFHGRQIYYGYDALAGYGDPVLKTVSQIYVGTDPQVLTRWSYGYAVHTGLFGDTSPLLTSMTSPHPNGPGSGTATAHIEYLSDARVSALEDANGNRRVYTYYPYATQVTVKGSDNIIAQSWTEKFDVLGRSIGTANASNQSDSISYSTSFPDRSVSSTDEAGRTTLMEYDSYGHMVATTSPRGVRTVMTYDYSVWSLGRLVKVQTFDANNVALPATTMTYYEPSGLIHTVTSPNPNGSGTVTTTATYDGLGNILTITAPGISGTRTTTFDYETDGSYTTSAAIGCPVLVTDELGHSVHLRYDSFFNPSRATDAQGNVTETFYNYANQPIKQILPATGQTGTGHGEVRQAYAYRGGPLLTTQIYTESGSVFRTFQTLRGAEGEVRSSTGNLLTQSVEYDPLYRVKGFLDGAGRRTKYFYDSNGRLSEVAYPRAGTTSGFDRTRYTSYDPSGLPLQRIDGRDVVTNYVYDSPDGALTAIQYPAATYENIAVSYDSFGHVQGRTDRSGVELYAYNAASNLSSVSTQYKLPNGTLGSAFVQTIAHNADGSRASLGTPLGNLNSFYDAAGHLTSLGTPAGTVSWGYSDSDRLLYQTLPTGHRVTYTQNALGQLDSLTNRDDTNTVLSQWGNPSGTTNQILHNAVGQLVSLPSATTSNYGWGGTTSYSYNLSGILSGESSNRGLGYSHGFSYDGAGNATSWKGATRTYNSDNQETTLGPNNGTQFDYDGAGNPWKYQNYNLASSTAPNGKGHILSYSAQGELRQINLQNAQGGSGDLVAKYTYRGDGLRAWKEDENGNRTYFYYDGDSLLATQSVTAAGVSSPSQLYLWGADDLIGSTWLDGAGARKASFYLYDAQGNLSQTVDGNGTLSAALAFDSWGEPIADANGVAAPVGTLGYGAKYGYLRDGESGFYLCSHRYYDPSAGRWLTRDPIGFDGGQNLYGYVGGDPANVTDPIGLAPMYREGQWSGLQDYFFRSGWGMIGNTGITIIGGTRSQRMGVAWSVLRVLNTKHAKKNWKVRPFNIVLYSKCPGGSARVAAQLGKLEVSALKIDMSQANVPVWTLVKGKEKLMPAPLVTILAHEMGHLFGNVGDSQRYDAKGNKIGGPLMENVDLNENPIRLELGFAPRTRY